MNALVTVVGASLFGVALLVIQTVFDLGSLTMIVVTLLIGAVLELLGGNNQ